MNDAFLLAAAVTAGLAAFGCAGVAHARLGPFDGDPFPYAIAALPLTFIAIFCGVLV